MSERLFNTFGNEVELGALRSSLDIFLKNATINFPLPDASSEILEGLIPDRAINPPELDIIKSKLINIGFKIKSANVMAQVLLGIAEQEGVDPFDYFEENERTLKFTADAYTAMNILRPKGNQVGIGTPTNNRRGQFSQLIQP